MLQIRRLNHEVEGRVIFDCCDLMVEEGDHIVIVGDSGGGKSTLLNLIVDGHPGVSYSRDCRNLTCLVLQEGALMDHLNVIQNLELVARYMRDGSKQAGSYGHMEQTLNQLNIDSSLYTAKVSELSGGQKRRVAIARALIMSPEFMLFDEPDAGLDVANLVNLASTMNQLRQEQGKTCVTVSHNPFYIALVATKVYRLMNGGLTQIADWSLAALDEATVLERQRELQQQLQFEQPIGQPDLNLRQQQRKRTMNSERVPLILLKGAANSIASLFHSPISFKDQLSIASYSLYLNLISGLVFFSLVGVMLGSTTLAVVRTLADGVLTGFIGWFVDPEDVIDIMRGRFALYLAPAVGGMLFVARSGSLVSNWVGEMSRTNQIRAIEVLGVPSAQYLVAPNVIALFLGMIGSLIVFCLSVWLGGVIAAANLFDVNNAYTIMSVTLSDINQSNFWPKVILYSALVAIIVSAFAFTPKKSAHQVNIHTTKSIIYATLSIALAELLMILL